MLTWHLVPAFQVAPEAVPEFLPELAEVAALQHYERCAALQENVWRQLPVIAQGLGKRVRPPCRNCCHLLDNTPHGSGHGWSDYCLPRRSISGILEGTLVVRSCARSEAAPPPCLMPLIRPAAACMRGSRALGHGACQAPSPMRLHVPAQVFKRHMDAFLGPLFACLSCQHQLCRAAAGRCAGALRDFVGPGIFAGHLTEEQAALLANSPEVPAPTGVRAPLLCA